MKKIFIISFIFCICCINLYGKKNKKHVNKKKYIVEQIDSETFRTKIFDFRKHRHWQYHGKKPLLIDFYTTWCPPCKRIAPILEQLQTEYGKKIKIYKVNIDHEKELKQLFRITSIPTFLFVPIDDTPKLAKGALSREVFIESIEKILKVKHPKTKKALLQSKNYVLKK